MPVMLPSDLRRIAVFRALNLGDFLCAVPALRALRAACPHADITLIGLPRMADVARRFTACIDSFTSFPGAPGLPEQPFNVESFTQFLRREHDAGYDLLLQMHGKGTVTNPIACMLGARQVAGYYDPGDFCPDPRMFMPYPADVPEVRRHLKLMAFLGVEPCGEALEFPVFDADWRALGELAQEFRFDGADYVCIHPGARDMRRWWAPERFAQVADELVRKGNVVIFTGTAGEHDTVERVRARMTRHSINLAGRTEIGTLGALIGRARLLVSNDTGASHMAAALGTRSVIIFLASDPARWAPLNDELHQAIPPGDSDDIDAVLCCVERALDATMNTATI